MKCIMLFFLVFVLGFSVSSFISSLNRETIQIIPCRDEQNLVSYEVFETTEMLNISDACESVNLRAY